MNQTFFLELLRPLARPFQRALMWRKMIRKVDREINALNTDFLRQHEVTRGFILNQEALKRNLELTNREVTLLRIKLAMMQARDRGEDPLIWKLQYGSDVQ